MECSLPSSGRLPAHCSQALPNNPPATPASPYLHKGSHHLDHIGVIAAERCQGRDICFRNGIRGPCSPIAECGRQAQAGGLVGSTRWGAGRRVEGEDAVEDGVGCCEHQLGWVPDVKQHLQPTQWLPGFTGRLSRDTHAQDGVICTCALKQPLAVYQRHPPVLSDLPPHQGVTA